MRKECAYFSLPMRNVCAMVQTVMAKKQKKRATNLSLSSEAVSALATLAKQDNRSRSGTVEILITDAHKTATARSRKGVA